MKPLPHNLEAERSVLGACFLNTSAVQDIKDILTPEMFYRTDYQRVYEAIINIVRKGGSVDMVTVGHELSAKIDLIPIMEATPSSADIENHALIVYEMHRRRQSIIDLSQAAEKCYAGDLDEVAEIAGKVSTMGLATKEERPVSEVCHEILEDIETGQKIGVVGLHTGIEELDEATGGLLGGELVTVAARTSVGKTAFAVGVAIENGVCRGVPTGIMTMEMSERQIAARLIAQKSRTSLHDIRTNRVRYKEAELKKVLKAVAEIAASKLTINDRSMNIADICLKARDWKRKKDIKLLCVDQLSRIPLPKSENKVQGLELIINRLKDLARELDIVVMLLMQLNRDSAKEKSQKLHHLAWSSEGENTSDIVLLLDRDLESQTDEALVKIAKNREGEIKTIPVVFNKTWAGFENVTFKPAY
jgi:replicative DNA helicase